MKIIDKVWFLKHCEWIYRNRDKLKDRPCANFIVTGFVINSFACPYYAYKIDEIKLGTLIELWNNGFVYNNLPLVHYRISHGDTSTHIAYIYRGKVFAHRFSYKDDNRYIPTDAVKEMLKKLRRVSRY